MENPKLLDLVLKLENVSPNFKVELYLPTLVKFAERCSIYNNMDRDSFVALAKVIAEKAPGMFFGPDHPNNGAPFVNIIVGNEGSRVIYITVLAAYLKMPWMERERLVSEYFKAVQTLAVQAHADEIDRQDKHLDNPDQSMWEYTLRLWWD